MANWLERAAEEAKKRARGVAAQINFRDGGATYDTVVNNKPVAQPQQAKRFVPLADPTKAMQPVRNTPQPSIADSINKAARVYGSGLKRSAIGTGQMLSGTYDLVTPGTGTNRFSKYLDQQAKSTDRQVKTIAPNNPLTSTLYKTGQLAGDAATFAGTGAGIKAGTTAAGKAPVIAKASKLVAPATNAVNNAAGRVISNVASRGPAGRIAASGLRTLTPTNLANVGLNTGLDLGSESGKGRDITKQAVATSLAGNLGINTGLPMVASGAREATAAARKQIFNNASKTITPQNVNISKLSGTDTSGYGDLDPIQVAHYKNEINNGRPVEPIIAMKSRRGAMPVEDGKHRLQAYRDLGITDIPTKVVTQKELKQMVQNLPVGLQSRMVDDAGNPTSWRQVREKKQAEQANKLLGLNGKPLDVDGNDVILYHNTSNEGYDGINKDGFIDPSRAGTGNDKAVTMDGRVSYLSTAPQDFYGDKVVRARMPIEQFQKQLQDNRDTIAKLEQEIADNKIPDMYIPSIRAQIESIKNYPEILSDQPLQIYRPAAEPIVPAVQPRLMDANTQTPEPPAIRSQADPSVPEQPSLPIITPQKGKETRYASRTVPNSEYVSEPLGRNVKNTAPTYDPVTEQQRYTSSLGRLKDQGEDQFALELDKRLSAPNGKISHQDVADGQSLAAIYDAKGDPDSLQKATNIYQRLSEHLTAAGQLVQAASVLSKRSPQGLQYWAQKQLREAGVEVTPQIQTTIKQLADATANAPDKNRAVFELTKFVSDNSPAKTSDKILTAWRAGLLTAPTTTGGNILGNLAETAIRKGFVNPVASGADWLMSTVTDKSTYALAPLGSGIKGAKIGAGKLPDFFKSGYDERNALNKYDNKEINYGNGRVGQMLNKYVNGTYRLMSVADMPFWYAAQRDVLGSIARSEANNRGLKGPANRKFVNDFIASPPEAALERATQEAAYGTFQNKTGLGKAAVAFKDGLNKVIPGLGDFVVPFTQVPASIATRIITRTPVGTAAEVVRQFVNVRNGGTFDQRAMAQSIGEGAFGAAVLGAGYSLANSGLMTFGYPTDPVQRKLWEAEGKQPYSVRVGDRWYSLNYIQPFGTILAVGAKAGEEIEAGKSLEQAIGSAIGTAGQSVANQSFVKGVSGAIDAVTDPERSVTKFVNQTGSSIVPNFIRAFARSIDDQQREQAGFVEGIKQGIPGLRQSTPAALDAFGQPLQAKDNFANQFFNPLRPSQARENNPVVGEVARLQKLDAGVLPSTVNKSSLGKDTELKKEQITELQNRVGAAVNDAWSQVIADPKYQSLTEENKAKALRSASTDAAAVVRRQYADEKGISYKSDLSPSQTAILKGTQQYGKYAASAGKVGGLPTNYDNLDDNVKKYLDTRVGVDDKEEWGAQSVDESGKDLIRRINQIRGEGMPELPDTNKVAGLYADFVANRDKNKWTPTRELQEKRKLMKEAYKSSLDDNESYWLSASDGLFRQGLDAGDIDQTMLDKMVAYDNLQVELGGSQQIGKKLRSLIGVAQPPKQGPYSSGGTGKRFSASDFESPYSQLIKYSTSGANLARTASLKR